MREKVFSSTYALGETRTHEIDRSRHADQCWMLLVVVLEYFLAVLLEMLLVALGVVLAVLGGVTGGVGDVTEDVAGAVGCYIHGMVACSILGLVYQGLPTLARPVA